MLLPSCTTATLGCALAFLYHSHSWLCSCLPVPQPLLAVLLSSHHRHGCALRVLPSTAKKGQLWNIRMNEDGPPAPAPHVPQPLLAVLLSSCTTATPGCALR